MASKRVKRNMDDSFFERSRDRRACVPRTERQTAYGMVSTAFRKDLPGKSGTDCRWRLSARLIAADNIAQRRRAREAASGGSARELEAFDDAVHIFAQIDEIAGREPGRGCGAA